MSLRTNEITLVIKVDKEGRFESATPFTAMKAAVKEFNAKDSYWVVNNTVSNEGIYVDDSGSERDLLYFRAEVKKTKKSRAGNM